MAEVERPDVVIVGAGLLGLATAYALRGRRDVLVIERETVGHARGGSHGPSRIFRLGYPDPIYVAMAQRAAEQWRALEADFGVQLLHPTPQLTFGLADGARTTVMIDLVGPVARGDELLVHAGTAIARLEEAVA